jgi:hypothetical protein
VSLIQPQRFWLGLLAGLVLGGSGFALLVLCLPNASITSLFHQTNSALESIWQLINLNLRSSVLVFAVVLLAFWMQLRKMQSLLSLAEPDLATVVRCEQSLDLCASLFFGTGVIWTAIGMRDALLFALGGRDPAIAQSAFLVLQRLVDGGILLALSTTIVGGVGGYFMRTAKTVLLGRKLTVLYMHASQQPAREHLASLQRIERHLSDQTIDTACTRNGA